MPFSGFKDLDPAFAASLQQYFAANPGLGAYSGYRDIKHQQRLWNASDKTGHSVARPGHSQHNFGGAADLEYNGVRLDRLPKEQQAALHKSAADYGLNFRMGHEPWHVEMLKGGGGGGGALAAATTGQEIPTTSSQFALPTASNEATAVSASPDISYTPPPIPEQPAYSLPPAPAAQVAQAEVAPIAGTDQKMAQRQQLAQILAALNSNRVA